MRQRRFKLNVGGTKYEVSNSLLDQHPDSMLRRITSDRWNEGNNNNDDDDDEEIFIERDGTRFKFVLDYMRDGKATLPLSVPRAPFISDMEYYGIDYLETNITLNVADPNDVFHELASYQYFFQSELRKTNERYYKAALEKVACSIASKYFETLISPPPATAFGESQTNPPNSSSYFQPRAVRIPEQEFPNFFSNRCDISALQPYLNRYGLKGSDYQYGYDSSSPYRNSNDVKFKVFIVELLSRGSKRRRLNNR